RANALEDNFRLYKMVNGQRLQFAGANGKVSSGQWHTIRVVAKGDRITCWFDGKQLIDAHDKTYTTGKIGLWTKADSVIAFDDLKVSIDGAATPTPFGFGGWLAMTKGNGGMDVMMGDLVLTEDEINPVMSALLDNGLEVTALHNHFFFESPRIFYMHVHGHGKAADLAKMAKPAVDLIGHGSPQHQSSVTGGSSSVSAGQIDTAKIAGIVGHDGEQNGSVYKITIGRDDLKLKEMGAKI